MLRYFRRNRTPDLVLPVPFPSHLDSPYFQRNVTIMTVVPAVQMAAQYQASMYEFGSVVQQERFLNGNFSEDSVCAYKGNNHRLF
jgi:hypothetical protein